MLMLIENHRHRKSYTVEIHSKGNNIWKWTIFLPLLLVCFISPLLWFQIKRQEEERDASLVLFPSNVALTCCSLFSLHLLHLSFLIPSRYSCWSSPVHLSSNTSPVLGASCCYFCVGRERKRGRGRGSCCIRKGKTRNRSCCCMTKTSKGSNSSWGEASRVKHQELAAGIKSQGRNLFPPFFFFLISCLNSVKIRMEISLKRLPPSPQTSDNNQKLSQTMFTVYFKVVTSPGAKIW